MNDINQIIIQYLDGTATAVEKKILLNWLKESEENLKEFSEIRDLWLVSNTNLSEDADTEQSLEQLRKRIFADLKVKSYQPVPLYKSFIKYAAIFILAFGLAYWLSSQFNTTPQQNTLLVNRLITSDNSRGRFILPDSTIVWLNRNSILEYPEIFNDKQREVKLTGEAYFEVTKQPGSAFHVTANDIQVEVTGTSFVVQNYENRKSVETVLLSGKVQVAGKGFKKADLLPDQRYVIDKTTGVCHIDTVNSSNYIGWINSKLVFDNHRLSDIITQMQGWYNIDIYCPPAFAHNVRMTFTIRDESIEEILRAIKFIIPVTSKWENETLYIESKR